jgi:HAD superfamily hydrolase (TIGR01509 family)
MDLERIGFKDLFAYAYFADDYQAKPAVDMYYQAASDLGLAPKEVCHVGDLWSTDVTGARNAGCSSVLYLNGAKRKRPDPLVLPDIDIVDLAELEYLV